MLFLASLQLDRLTDFLPKEPFVMAFVPTAAGGEGPGPWPWVEQDRTFFEAMDCRIDELALTDLPEAGASVLDEYDHVHVTGGNTFYLLQEMRRSGFDQALTKYLNDGGSYSGASAGAIVVSQDIAWASPFDDRSKAPLLSDTKGLGLVQFDPLVHWDGAIQSRREDVRNELLSQGRRVVPLRDHEAAVVDSAGERILATDGTERAIG